MRELSQFQIFFAVLSAIILFLHALRGFSHEIQKVGGARLSQLIGLLTANRWRGFALGIVTTALVQSSSAVSALALTLVESGVLTFRNSLGVLIGANVGTTATDWLVAWKLTSIGPIFIVLGAFVGTLKGRVRIFGRSLFYFGFIFFSLNIVDTSLAPVRELGAFREWLSQIDHPFLAIGVGALATALVQSSSVITGLAILLVQQGLIQDAIAIPLVMGANIGTTSTALLSSLAMGTLAKRTAIANLGFNLGGVLLFLPLLDFYIAWTLKLSSTPELTVAYAHLIFNVAVSVVFLTILRPYERLLTRWVPTVHSIHSKMG